MKDHPASRKLTSHCECGTTITQKDRNESYALKTHPLCEDCRESMIGIRPAAVTRKSSHYKKQKPIPSKQFTPWISY